MDHIQAMPRPVQSRLVMPEQPYIKQEPGNYWHEHKHACHQHISDIPISTSIEDIQVATQQDAELQRLKSYISHKTGHIKRRSRTKHEALLAN